MKDINIIAIVGLKGGVGKTNTAWHIVPAWLASNKKDFSIFEIDDNNESFNFKNSDVLGEAKTVKTDDEEVAADMVIETMSNNTVVVDGGGGNDTRAAISLVKSVGDDVNKIWLIPFNRTKDDFKLAIQTAELIDEPNNTYFLLNGFTEKTKEKEFKWFYDLNISNFIEVPYSENFSLSQSREQTIFDFAQISKNMIKSTAKKIFENKFTKDGELDKNAFKNAFKDFLNSEIAAKEVEVIINSFEVTFGAVKEQKIVNKSEEEQSRVKK